MVSINRYPLHSQSAPGSHLHSTMVSINPLKFVHRHAQKTIYIPLWYLLILQQYSREIYNMHLHSTMVSINRQSTEHGFQQQS